MAAGDINDMKKAAEAYAKAITASEKSAVEMQKTFGDIGAALLDLSANDFFKEIERSPEIMQRLEVEAKKLTDELKNSGNEINKIFSGAFKNTTGGKSAIDKIQEQTLKLRKDFPEAAKLMEEEITRVRALANGTAKDLDFAYILSKSPQEAAEFSKALLGTKASAGKLEEEINKTVMTSLKLSEIEKDLAKTTTQTFSATEGMKKFVERNFALRTIIKDILKYDEDISKAQRETGILFKDNTKKMQELVVESARFGLSAADIAGFMGQVGDTLNTTNFALLSKAADDTKALSMSTGAAYGDITKLTAQFMSLGGASEDVAGYIQHASSDAKAMGLSSAKIVKDLNANFTKFRTMGFVGGEKSLEKMAILAQKLRVNIDDIFNVSEKARSIEGAMEMAADLQLAGGAAANIDPMQLLAAARNDPKELAKILSKMTSDIGKFNKETGEVEFNPIDKDRMDMIAKATGESMDSIIASTTKAKQRMQKESAGLFSGFENQKVGDVPLTDILEQMSTVGKGGVIKMSGAFDGKSIQDLKAMSQADIKAKIEDYNHTKETDEEAAKRNMGFNESLSALKISFMNVFTALEPVIKWLTSVLNGINSMPVIFKEAVAAIGIVLAIAFGPAKAFLNGIAMGKGFTFATQGGGFFKSLMGAMNPFKGGVGGAPGGGVGGGGGAGTPSGNMFGMNPTQILALGKAAGAAAPGILALGAAILMIGGGIAIASLGLAQLVGAFALLTGPQILGAIAAIALVMGGFVGMLYLMIPAVAGLAAAGTAGAIGLLALGASFLMIGGGIALAAYGMSLFVTSLAKMNPNVLSGMGVGLIEFATGLGVLTVAMFAFANPFSLFAFGAMVVALSSLSVVMSALGPNLSIGGAGMSAMAKGVTELSAALKQVDTEVLDKLKDINAAAGMTALTQAVNNMAAGNSGGGNSTVQKFEFTVIVKNESGREIQRKIIKDTDLIK